MIRNLDYTLDHVYYDEKLERIIINTPTEDPNYYDCHIFPANAEVMRILSDNFNMDLPGLKYALRRKNKPVELVAFAAWMGFMLVLVLGIIMKTTSA